MTDEPSPDATPELALAEVETRVRRALGRQALGRFVGPTVADARVLLAEYDARAAAIEALSCTPCTCGRCAETATLVAEIERLRGDLEEMTGGRDAAVAFAKLRIAEAAASAAVERDLARLQATEARSQVESVRALCERALALGDGDLIDPRRVLAALDGTQS